MEKRMFSEPHKKLSSAKLYVVGLQVILFYFYVHECFAWVLEST
jgi:hypothetical protein